MEETSGIVAQLTAWITNPIVFVPLLVIVAAGVDRLVQKTENEWDNKIWFSFVRKPLTAWIGSKKKS